MINKLLGIGLLLTCFFHGAFASGFMPILEKNLRDQSSLAFTLYFVGIFIGQMTIYFLKKLSLSKFQYCLYEIGFSLSLIFMAIFTNFFGLTFGRLLEGLFAGMALPLLFAILIQLETFLTLSKRIALFNSIFSLGFVLGTPLVEKLLTFISSTYVLSIFGIILIVLVAIMISLGPIPLRATKEIKFVDVIRPHNIKNRFFTLLIAKTFYGFILGTVTAHRVEFFPNLSMTSILLWITGAFILGQFISVKLINFFPKEHIQTASPIIIFLLTLYYFHNPNIFILLLLASMFHSMLLFVAFKNLGEMPSGARGFALYNAITDIGMILGSSLSFYPLVGVNIFGFIALVPVLMYLFEHPSKVRAERLFPFVGPITLFKVYKRQKNPYKENIDIQIKNVTFDPYSENINDSVKLLFFGDLSPTKIKFNMSKDLNDLCLQHNHCYFNLEGTQNDATYSKLNNKLLFDIPDDQIKEILSKLENYSLSIVNNHIFDRGIENFQKTIDKYSQSDTLITSQGNIREISNIRFGEIAIAYGSNFPWRNHRDAFFVKPQRLLNPKDKKRIELAEKIQKIKSESDILILSYHWGYECEYWPSDLQYKCSLILKEMGVDIIYGHHSHTAQGYMLRDNFCTLYSLGNFVSNMDLPIYKQGVAYSVEIDKRELVIKRITPYYFEVNTQRSTVDLINKKKSLAFQNWFIVQSDNTVG